MLQNELRLTLMHLRTTLNKFKQEKLTCETMSAHIPVRTN